MIANYYAARGERPVWFRAGGGEEAVRELVTILGNAELDGLHDARRLAVQVEETAALAATGDSDAIKRAEQTLSTAWLLYVQVLGVPPQGMIFGDPALVPRMPRTDEVLDRAARATSLASHVRSVASVNPFYAELRAAALRQGHLSPSAEAQVKGSLERARMLPATGNYVLVDVASQRLFMVENGRAAESMKVIVGKPDQPTPMIASTMRHATFNPYWNVPPDLLRRNIAPRAMADGLPYLRERGYEILADWSEDAPVIDPGKVDWIAVADGRVDLRVRQRPGSGNMMGKYKFAFPNGKGIYLHDTPDKALFREARRTFSSGCIRLEDALRLARWLLGREPSAPSTRPEAKVPLPRPVPVYVTYLTAQVSGGELALVEDVYRMDQQAEQRLAER